MRTSVQEPEPVPAARTISFCAVCRGYTPHEWREGDGIVAKICVSCFERSLLDLLDRD
jgi:hypothetical protein